MDDGTPIVLDGGAHAAHIPVYFSAAELEYVSEVLRWVADADPIADAERIAASVMAGEPGVYVDDVPSIVAEGLTAEDAREVRTEALHAIAGRLSAALDRPDPHWNIDGEDSAS